MRTHLISRPGRLTLLAATLLLATGGSLPEPLTSGTALLEPLVGPARVAAAEATAGASDVAALARQVTIYRDEWGIPHIDGPTDAAVLFGLAYAQCEDYFWQVEDTYILASGRYAEVHGGKGLNSDLLNRAFEVVPTSKRDYEKLDPNMQEVIAAFTAGMNYYLERHPEVRPRLITQFEPWMVVAFGRQLLVEMGYRYTRLSHGFMPRTNEMIYAPQAAAFRSEDYQAHVGSNAWALAPSRTASGGTMLYINPHQPWFGFGQFYECHLRSGEGWNFTGGTFFGNPMPGLGHNEHLGWAFTVNEPDIADAWIETFDDPNQPLNYRYGDGYRTATEWQETIQVRLGTRLRPRTFVFRKTHHGPIVAKRSDTQFVSAQIAKLYESLLLEQILKMVRATNFEEFYAGMSMLNFQFMNTVYADRHGNIFYVYNATVPRRDPQFDWSQPVDGSDPRTEWQGYHPIEDLPQVLNPPAGFLQSCNQTPFTVTDVGSPARGDFPHYMVEDKDDDKRRAKLSRLLLRDMHDVTFEDFQRSALDTTLYWPLVELPRYRREFERLRESDSSLAAEVAPYLEHLLDWDCRGGLESTQATLCVGWYEELYGTGYPAETLLPDFVGDYPRQFKALVRAAGKLQQIFGDWKVRWGDVHRIQRHADVADFIDIPFSDEQPSLPCAGLPGPLGVAFVAYYTPTIRIPLVRTVDKRYGVVGNTYMSVVEFGPSGTRSVALTQFGASANPASPHFMDQAALLSESRFRPALFDWKDVEAGARVVYHPGEEHQAAAVGGR